MIMVTAALANSRSVHRVNPKFRWLTASLVPPLIALMSWAGFEAMHNNPGDDGEIQLWVVLLSLLIFGGMSLVFLGAAVWAFRARVVIDGERMTVRGVFFETSVTAKQMNGFRYLNGQFHLYLKDRRFAIQIAYFEDLRVITQWIRQRTRDLVEEMLDEEDAAISSDASLGFTEADKAERLDTLRNLIQRINFVVYIAAGIAFVNFLFIEHVVVEFAAVGVLVVTPVFLDLLALSNRGHVRIDYDEGSRYPQIFTGTMVAGVSLALMSLLDRGALLDNRFYEILFLAILAKGLFLCFIDRDRLKVLLRRGRGITALTVVAMFAMPAFWVGGSLYQTNKLLDTSPTTWHATQIVNKRITSGKTTSYTVELAPWDPAQKGVVEYTLRRAEFERFEEGTPVRVGVRQGAVGIPWASDLVPAAERLSDVVSR